MSVKPMAQQLAYRPEPRPELYNIVVVVVDDLRADHLSLFGYERDTAPLLTARAETGTVFTQCYSPVGWTLPACASIITGQLPDDHRLVDHNCVFQKPKIGHYLGDAYHRVGITNNGNVVTDSISREYLEKLGLKRRPAKWRFFHWNDGFDRYDWVAREDHLLPFQLAREFLDGRADGKGESFDGEEPYFLFLHSNLVHDYHMDRDYYLEVEQWGETEIHPALRGVRDGPDAWRDRTGDLDLKFIEQQMIAKYDSGIHRVDRELDEIFRRIDFDRTIVAFMSDHGEGFDGTVGRVHHCGRLHQDLTHVPLVLWLPPELRKKYEASGRIDRHCSTVDLVPSLLTLLGDAVAGFPGQFLYDLTPHRKIVGCDRGYVYWNDDCVRESYDTARIEIRSEFTYPLKEISVSKNDTRKDYAYNLAYDPKELDNLAGPVPRSIPNFEPISFVVALNDHDEYLHNLAASPIARSPHHEWMLIENEDNSKYGSISELYADALSKAKHDLVFFVHQDLFLPHGWEERVFGALAELEAKDPNWGVIGGVGALAPMAGEKKQLRGHWCDPSGYHRMGTLPHEVQSLDEQWLGVRKRSGVDFDPDLPGFHCYGIDLSLAALERGLKSYAVDAFVWHKYKDSSGYLICERGDSSKIRERWGDAFMADFQPCADYVERKWKKYLPFQTTSWTWGVD
ncbi:MAG: sulfatase-like hydrolase/transferase [Planctomycetota bacterium]